MMEAEQWRMSLLPQDSSIQQAIQSLDQSGSQIVVVIDADGGLVGAITDGDIRRGLLRGLDLSSAVATIVNRAPLICPPLLGRDLALQLMQANRIRQLPVVDDARRVVGLHVWDDLQGPADRTNLMVVMAGGKGTRLRPHTENCPKPMLPVGGRPMIEHIVERARNEGFSHFVFAVHYLGHMIEDHFGDGSRWGVRIDYLREQTPLGTGGALGLMAPRPDRAFVVTNGDVLTDVRYSDVLDYHERHGAVATMAVRAHEWQHPFGVVHTKGVDIVSLEEKPIVRSHVNAGVYVIEPRALDVIVPDVYCDMPTVFERLQAVSERTIVYPMHELWLDVGRPADLDTARSTHA